MDEQATSSTRARVPTSGSAVRVLAVALSVVALLLLWPFRGPVVFALVIGYLAHPLYARLARALPRRWMAAGLVLVLVGALLVAPLVLLGGLLLQEARDAAVALATPDGIENAVEDALERLGMDPAQAGALIEAFRARAVGFLEEMAVPTLARAAEALVGVLIFFILLYFALVDGPRLVEWIRRLSPLDSRPHRRLMEAAGERVKGLVWGSLLLSLAQGILAALGWWLLGMPSPVLWGSVMALLAIVPVVGPFLVLVPGALYAFAVGNYVAAAGLLVLNFVLVGLVDDVLRPALVGRWTSVHPAIILLGILGGIPLMGLSGLLIGPLLLSLLAPVLEAWLRPGEGPLEAPRPPPPDTRAASPRGRGERGGS